MTCDTWDVIHAKWQVKCDIWLVIRNPWHMVVWCGMVWWTLWDNKLVHSFYGLGMVKKWHATPDTWHVTHDRWFLSASYIPLANIQLFCCFQSCLLSVKVPIFCWNMIYTVICPISEMSQTPVYSVWYFLGTKTNWGQQNNDIMWKSLDGIVLNGVPREVPRPKNLEACSPRVFFAFGPS